MLKKPVFSPAQPLRAETHFSRASFSPRKHPQRSPRGEQAVLAAWGGRVRNATPPVLPSAAALLAGFLSILRDNQIDKMARQTGLVSEFIHVDDFRGLP
jgi:hypothetical protein